MSATPIKFHSSRSKGFSLIEVVIVLAILAVLAVIGYFSYQKHLFRARDAHRKADLERLKIAFEDYYNDHRCYPPPEVLLDCGQDTLSPYINEIPCDPLDNSPYQYFSRYGRYCMGVRILVNLEMDNDPEIEAIGCDFEDGCGWEDYPEYNYGVAIGDNMAAESWYYGGSPDDGSPAGRYYCVDSLSGGASCSRMSYSSLLNYICPKSYEEATPCESECIDREGVTDEQWETEVVCQVRE